MSKISTKPPSGMRDFLPADLVRRRAVIDVVVKAYEAHGFTPLETPSIENLSTLTGKYGEEGDQLMYRLLHRRDALRRPLEAAHAEGRPARESELADQGLRYDLTVPLARVVAQYGQLPRFFKRYQIQPVWRADRPGRGRFREFYQCDVDVCGSTSRAVEADVLSAAAECLRKLGFGDFTLRLNHRGLLRALIDVAGIDSALETDAIVAIDKLDKVGLDGVDAELAERGIADAARKRLLTILDGDAGLDAIRSHMQEHPAGLAAVEDVQQVLSLSEVTPAAGHVHFDVTLARGLGYYTGCIFEIAVPDLRGSLGGGGRYDGLIGMFLGKDVPACGLSLGLERILVVMAERGMLPASGRGPEVTVGATADTGLRAAIALCATLRRAGLRVDLRPQSLKPAKLRKYADEQHIAAAVWLDGDGDDPGASLSLWTAAQDQTQHGLGASDVIAALGPATGGA